MYDLVVLDDVRHLLELPSLTKCLQFAGDYIRFCRSRSCALFSGCPGLKTACLSTGDFYMCAHVCSCVLIDICVNVDGSMQGHLVFDECSSFPPT